MMWMKISNCPSTPKAIGVLSAKAFENYFVNHLLPCDAVLLVFCRPVSVSQVRFDLRIKFVLARRLFDQSTFYTVIFGNSGTFMALSSGLWNLVKPLGLRKFRLCHGPLSSFKSPRRSRLSYWLSASVYSTMYLRQYVGDVARVTMYKYRYETYRVATSSYCMLRIISSWSMSGDLWNYRDCKTFGRAVHKPIKHT